MITLLGLFLAWQIVQKGVSAYLAHEAPKTALWLRMDEPTALVNLADAMLNRRSEQSGSEGSDKPYEDRPQDGKSGDRLGSWSEIALRAWTQGLGRGKSTADSAPPPPLTDAERIEVRMLAERALRADPLNARALRILGQLAEDSGDRDGAIKFMQAAARRSLSESAAVYAMMRATFDAKEYGQAVYYADALMRKRSQLVQQGTYVLARMAESGDPQTSAMVEQLLASNPPWRGSFFSNLNNSITDARTPLKLLLALKDTAAPPNVGELKPYLNFLIEKRFFELAYYTWLQFLPPVELTQVGLLNNGAFSNVPSGLPFDWTIADGPGVSIDLAVPPYPGSGTDKALLMEFGPGRVSFQGVSQMLMLSPGNYRFAGRYRGEIKGPRGVQWHVRCLGNSSYSSDGPMFIGSVADWRKFDFTFSVPDTDCRAQELRVDLAARSASEQLVSGVAWYDDLRLERVDSNNEADAPEPAETP